MKEYKKNIVVNFYSVKDHVSQSQNSVDVFENYFEAEVHDARDNYTSFLESKYHKLIFESINGGFLLPKQLLSGRGNNVLSHFCWDDDWEFYMFSRFIGLYYHNMITLYSSIYPLYMQHGLNAIFFKNAYNKKYFYQVNSYKTIEVSFIGSAHNKDRVEKVRFLKDNNIDIKVFGVGWDEYDDLKSIWGGFIKSEDISKVINASKINLNLSYNALHTNVQPKGRFLEIAGCGGFQITEDSDVFNQWFKNDVSIVTYDDTKEDLLKKVKYYLENYDIALNIAKNSYQIAQNFIWEVQLKHLIEKVSKNNKTIPYYNILSCIKNIKVYILLQDQTDNLMINSINSQLMDNIEIVTDCHVPNYCRFRSISFSKFVSLIENSEDSFYISFFDKNSLIEKEKIFFQVYALENDKKDGIFINCSSLNICNGSNKIHVNFRMLETLADREWIQKVPMSSILLNSTILSKTRNLTIEDFNLFVKNILKNNGFRYIQLGKNVELVSYKVSAVKFIKLSLQKYFISYSVSKNIFTLANCMGLISQLRECGFKRTFLKIRSRLLRYAS